MTTKMKIFSIKNLIRVCAVVVLCGMSVGAYSGGYDDDDYDDCQYFSPAYALCSTHAYNYGMLKNPSDSGQISEMNNIIALKSTVIAQQMKQQYDVLNAMVKRFKTQLEKSVLKSKIEVMTGGSSSSSSSSSGGSSSNNAGLANAEDCYAVTSQADVYDCFTRNLNKISQAADKDTVNARKQLVNDIDIMKAYADAEGKQFANVDKEDCESAEYANKNAIKKCVQYLQVKVRQAKTNYDREEAKARGSRY